MNSERAESRMFVWVGKPTGTAKECANNFVKQVREQRVGWIVDTQTWQGKGDNIVYMVLVATYHPADLDTLDLGAPAKRIWL